MVALVALATFVSLAAHGCRPAQQPQSDTDPDAARNVELRVLVTDDAALAGAIEALAGEWKALSGASLRVTQIAANQLRDADAMPAQVDAVIYPSALLGTLAERDWIVPLPEGFEQNRELRWSDTFELLQVAATRWQQSALAVPLGSPVFTCYYRPDLFERFHRRPPRTWEEYRAAAEFFGNRDNLGDAAPADDAQWYGCVEPLAETWRGRLLLARAAAYVKHRDHYSTLFDIDTMEPRIGTAGFVRALEELAADAKLGPEDHASLDPDAVREAFLSGRAALALTWPAHGRGQASDSKDDPAAVGFAELSGAREVYNVADDSWERRANDQSPHVTLLSVSGRLGSVAQSAAHPEVAFQFLGWLSGKDWGAKVGSVSSASAATTLYRRSQIRQPQPWVDAGTDIEAAQQYATTVYDALSREQYLFALRVPGHERYLAALDEAVGRVLAGDTSAADALAAAGKQWQAITDELGRDAQRTAYRRSLGLEP